MTITAHAGAYGTPDNSIENVRKVTEENCEIFEIDVTFRPGGTPVIVHDGNPSETDGVPLDDVFAIVAKHPSICINLDLKSVNNLPAIDALLEKYGIADRVFYTGVGESWTGTVAANSKVPYYLNVAINENEMHNETAVNAVADKIISSGATGLNISHSSCSEEVVKVMHSRNLPVSVWTVNDRETALKFIKMGVDNITSRVPDTVKSALAEYAG